QLELNSMKKWLKILLIIQIFINLVGALGPELGFDALWYHLTEAKLFLQQRYLYPIPVNLLYWSGLPRLGEIFYMFLPGKLVHWAFGVLSAYFIYRLSGFAGALLWYSTLLVGWLSTSAYVDLIVTAFLLAAVYYQKVKRILFIILASAVKLQGFAFGLAITLIPWGILGILPFSLINYQATGNPFYPFLGQLNLTHEWFYNGFTYWLSRPIRLFFDPTYRVGPIILIVFLINSKYNKYLKLTLLSFFLWSLFPGTDFGRFALFPLALMALSALRPHRLVYYLIILQALVGISGRAWANAKYLNQKDFLCRNLNFDFGDFYDCDGWFKQNIKPTDKVLIYNIHNLYYVDFPYDHESWQNPATPYTHILVGDNGPEFNLPLIYQNSLTRVKLYLNEPQ
ncbi:MAG: hypothetical protein U0946_06760, partial [Patescibacteria group bacterium]|nr:hypothetical protein [Patescibacteria group bacterium]